MGLHALREEGGGERKRKNKRWRKQDGKRGLLCSLYKLDTGTSGTSQSKACFEETSVLASFSPSFSPSLDIQSHSLCHH